MPTTWCNTAHGYEALHLTAQQVALASEHSTCMSASAKAAFTLLLLCEFQTLALWVKSTFEAKYGMALICVKT